MPDIIQVAEDLKNAPDQWLAQQMQSPTGSAPPWLVASEVARREKLRSGAAKAAVPQSSVSQDLIRSLYAKIPPTAGLAPQATNAPPGMPPVNLSPGSNSGTLGSPPPGATPPANFKTPPRMAAGGAVDEETDTDTPDDLYNLPLRQPSRQDQLNQLMVPPVPTPAPVTPPAAATPPAAPAPSGPVGSAARYMPDTGEELTRLVNDAAQRYQVPPEMIRAVIKSESSGQSEAVGPLRKGQHAIGLMQIMPATAAEMGVTDPKALLDPAVNIDTGARYLKKMLNLFDNDPRKALAAYNAGPGAVKKYDDVPPYGETIGYADNTLKTINALRAKSGLGPLDPNELPAVRNRLVTQTSQPQPQDQGTFNDWRQKTPAAAATPQLNLANVQPTTSDTAPTTTPADSATPAAAAAVVKKEPLHQTWTAPETSPEAAQIDAQIAAKQKGHLSVEDRYKALFGADNLALLQKAGETFFGKPQDYSQYSQAIQNVMQAAQQNMHPSISQMLVQFGMALMASPSHYFGQAVGQAGAQTMASYQKLQQEGAKDYLAAAKAGVELQDKVDLYNARIGQYKMQRLGAQQTGIAQDERAFQSDIAALERQKNTAQINYEKSLTTPAAVNNMAAAIMNRENIQFDPKGNIIQQLAAVGRPDLLNEAFLAGKPAGANKGMNSVQQTQDIRAVSLLSMLEDDFDPGKNPEDAQYPTAMDKLKHKHPDLAGLATTAQGANFPEQIKEAKNIAAGVVAGRVDPSMTGMYGKQVLIKSILENEYHYDLAKAVLEWDATKKFIQTANAADAIKYRTAVNFVSNQVPLVQNAYDGWKKAISEYVPDFMTRFKGFNRQALNTSLAMGGELGAAARKLESHIAELQTSLPLVYSGGYAPHSEDIDRAGKMIASDWDDASFSTGLGVIGDTMLARKNAVEGAQPRPASSYSKDALGGGTGGATGAGGAPQTEAIPPLPQMLSPFDVGKVYLNRAGKKVRITDVNRENWKLYKAEEVQ